MQHGYVVHDVEAAAAQWAQRVGAGPFYILDRLVLDQHYFHGVRTPIELRLGFGYWGSLQIELTQPLDDADTLYRRALRNEAGKLNHCATVVSNIDAVVAGRQLQARIIQAGSMPTGLKFVYLDEYLPGGQHLEMIEMQEATSAAFAGMEAVGRTWDGSDPIRAISRLQQDLAALQ
jgi:hypothetical protein